MAITMPQNMYSDGLAALKLVFQISWRKSLTAWLFVPFGIMVTLALCYGVDSLISLSSVSFPASVACMIVLFFALILCDLVLGNRKTKAIISILDIPLGFALRYISLCFTPAFVILPLSPAIGGVEVGKVIAVFLLGFVVMFAVTAYFVRGLLLLLGSSKRAMTERAEEMGAENDSIPLAEISGSTPQTSRPPSTLAVDTPRASTQTSNGLPSPSGTPPRTPVPVATKGVVSEDSTGESSLSQPTESSTQQPLPRQAPPSLTRPQKWATFVNGNFDRLIWSTLFLFIGLPVYYTTGYAMPIQLTVNILAYLFAISLPTKWKQFLHPVLFSSLITVLTIWILGLIHGNNLNQILSTYKTNSKYIKLWHGGQDPKPGAADILDSILDASIVAFALPMFQYRKELYQHFFAIVIPNIAISIASLFGYPVLCYAIGISSKRSLAFAARSLTLALATPAISNLGGDLNTVSAVAIMSGILGVLIGPKLLKWMRIPEDDYITRGVTMGGNSSAIATALLLVSDPRAAALSSLSMSLFGVITVALTSVPPIVRAVQSLVGE